MSLVVITFNISDPEKSEVCREYIKSKEHIELHQSAYIVKTTQVLEFLRKDIAELMQKDDKLFISKVRGRDWISYHLGRNKRMWVEENV